MTRARFRFPALLSSDGVYNCEQAALFCKYPHVPPSDFAAVPENHMAHLI